jgi:hypothetical protein
VIGSHAYLVASRNIISDSDSDSSMWDVSAVVSIIIVGVVLLCYSRFFTGT